MGGKLNKNISSLIMYKAQRYSPSPVHQIKVLGSIPSQGTYRVGCEFDPLGIYRRQPVDVSPPPSPSLKSTNTSSGEDLLKKIKNKKKSTAQHTIHRVYSLSLILKFHDGGQFGGDIS